MNDKMIINARKHLPLHRRLLSDVVTALMWAGWIWLWLPVIRTYHQLIRLGLNPGAAAEEVLESVSPVSLENSLLAVLGTSALLMLWALLPSHRTRTSHTVQNLQDYAEAFALEETEITAGQASRICTVHHDEHGHIIRIETENRTGS